MKKEQVRGKISGKKKRGAKRGPKPDILKLEGDWRELMKQSLQKRSRKTAGPANF
jgi:hypothetical protein